MIIKKGKTNWKYLLVVIILAVVVGGGISWLLMRQEIILPLFKLKQVKREITEREKLPIFLSIFPEGTTGCDLDRIPDINERVKAYFQGLRYFEEPDRPNLDDWDEVCWGSIKYIELGGGPDYEVFLTHADVSGYIHEGEKLWYGVPTPGPINVLRWDGEKWNVVGRLSFALSSWYTIEEVESSVFPNISTRHHFSAGSHIRRRYKWNGEEYILDEKALCAWDPNLKEEYNCAVWSE